MHDREQILSTCVISNTKTNHLLKIVEIMPLVVTLIMLCCCWSCWSWCSWWWSHLHYLEAAWLIACAGRERSRNYSEVCSIVQCSPGPENWRGEVEPLWRCFHILCVNLCVRVIYIWLPKNCLAYSCVTRAPILYFIRSWVALSFKVVSQWVSKASVTPVQISTLFNI